MFKHEPHPDYQPAFGFYSNFPTSILISVFWVLPWMECYTIRTLYSLWHRFKYTLSIQKEYFKFLVQITLKIDGIFLAMSEHCRYTRVPKDGNRRVGSPTSWCAYTHAGRFAYIIWRIASVIRCPCITFNSVRRRIYMWRPRGVRQLLTNLQSGSSPFLLLLFLHPVL